MGARKKYDIASALQFNLMTALGVREHHTLLDIGCGSLSAGRLFLCFLNAGNYFGIEPNAWLIEEAVRHELGEEIIRIKRPEFRHDASFCASAFNRSFDFVLAHSVLTHASGEQLITCLREVRSVLAPEGLFAATFADLADHAPSDDWRYPEFTSFSMPDVIRHAREQDLRAFPLIWPNPYHQYWMAFVRSDYPGEVSWLASGSPEVKAMRIIELHRENAMLARELADAKRDRGSGNE